MTTTQKPDEAGFHSKLGAPRDRFLSTVVDHALGVGRRSAKDFLRFFPPRDIMNALGDQPRLRAKLLVATTGLNEKIALRKPASTAGEDLEIALSEKVTTEEAIVELFDQDDRVRYLEHAKLWAFLIEGEFWRTNADAVAVPREHIAFILSRARAERLLADHEIVDGIGLDVLVGCLPRAEIVRVLDRAIGEGRAGRAFKDERVLEILTPQLLVEHVSLVHLWERLIGEKLAFGKPATPTEPNVSERPERLVRSEHPERAEREAADATMLPTPVPPPPSSPAPRSAPLPVASLSSEDTPPSLNLSIEEDEPILIDEVREDDLGVEVDAMLSGVGAPQPSETLEVEATNVDERSPRPSSPPPR